MIKMDTKSIEGTQILQKNMMRHSEMMTMEHGHFGPIFFFFFLFMPTAFVSLNQQFRLGQLL